MTHDEPTLREQLASYVGVGESVPVEPAPALAISDDERLAWTGSLTAGWPAAVAAALLIAGAAVVAFGASGRWVGLILIAAGLPALAFSRIHVLADARGVRVRFGWLPWPSKFVPLERIEHAAEITLRPTEWGGWGYRIARPAKGFSRSAVVLRGGAALHLTLVSGREFAVTVDRAAEAASVVNALVTRR